jgi:hypothetical protein
MTLNGWIHAVYFCRPNRARRAAWPIGLNEMLAGRRLDPCGGLPCAAFGTAGLLCSCGLAQREMAE